MPFKHLSRIEIKQIDRYLLPVEEKEQSKPGLKSTVLSESELDI